MTGLVDEALYARFGRSMAETPTPTTKPAVSPPRKPLTADDRDGIMEGIRGICERFDCSAHTVAKFARIVELTDAPRRRIFVKDIQEAVARRYRVPSIEMTSARRAREVSHPRQVAMYLSKQLTPSSLPEIGRMFGDRDHTTVMHAIRAVEARRAADSRLDRDLTRLARELS